jgi:hypothetical protein
VHPWRALTHLFPSAVALAFVGCVSSVRVAERPAPVVHDAHMVAASKSAALGTTASDDAKASAAKPPAPVGPELPRGGRTLFPRYRLVGFCGTPGAPALGELTGNLGARAKELAKLAEQYGGDREVLPVFELIAVVVMGAPGPDKAWRRRVPASVIDEYLRAARASKAILLLNIQPGHSDFLTEVKALEPWLREPDVGIALDPEWAMWQPNQKPGSVYGQTTGEVVNDVAAYLAGLVRDYHLPEKALVFHQVNTHVFKDEAALRAQPGVVLVKSVDGLGYTGAKIATYHYLVKSLAPEVHPGFKLFFDEDVRYGGRLMGPKEVMGLTPVPEYVMYE